MIRNKCLILNCNCHIAITETLCKQTISIKQNYSYLIEILETICVQKKALMLV